MQWFRVHAARIAAVTLLWMAVVGGSAVVPHEDDAHAAYGPVAVPHDESAHRLEAAGWASESHPLHCLVCHWARSFRPPTEARVASLPAGGAGISVPLELFSISAAAPVSQPPLRSPPSSPTA
jgi:hypothetical protein